MYDSVSNLLEQKLNKYENTDLDKVDRNTVEDISNIKIDTKKSSVERILDFLMSYENPYVFKIGDNLVKVQFSNDNIYADNCITNVSIISLVKCVKPYF